MGGGGADFGVALGQQVAQPRAGRPLKVAVRHALGGELSQPLLAGVVESRIEHRFRNRERLVVLDTGEQNRNGGGA